MKAPVEVAVAWPSLSARTSPRMVLRVLNRIRSRSLRCRFLLSVWQGGLLLESSKRGNVRYRCSAPQIHQRSTSLVTAAVITPAFTNHTGKGRHDGDCLRGSVPPLTDCRDKKGYRQQSQDQGVTKGNDEGTSPRGLWDVNTVTDGGKEYGDRQRTCGGDSIPSSNTGFRGCCSQGI